MQYKKGTVLTMTQREFFEMVIANEGITEEMITHAKTRIEALDKRNSNRTSKPSKTQIANEPIKRQIAEVLEGRTEESALLASDIATMCNISIQKAVALVKQIEGVQSIDVKVKGKGVRKAFFLV